MPGFDLFARGIEAQQLRQGEPQPGGDPLGHRQGREQRTVLEHHAPLVLHGVWIARLGLGLGGGIGHDVGPKNRDRPGRGVLQADNAP